MAKRKKEAISMKKELRKLFKYIDHLTQTNYDIDNYGRLTKRLYANLTPNYRECIKKYIMPIIFRYLLSPWFRRKKDMTETSVFEGRIPELGGLTAFVIDDGFGMDIDVGSARVSVSYEFVFDVAATDIDAISAMKIPKAKKLYLMLLK